MVSCPYRNNGPRPILISPETGSAEEQNHHLGDENAQEHCKRVNGSISDRGLIAVLVDIIRIGEGRRIGGGTGQNADKGEIVQLHAETAYQAAYQQRKHSYQRAEGNPYISALVNDSIHEIAAGFEAHAGEKETDAGLPEHQIGAWGRIGDYIDSRSEIRDEYADDERSAGKTQLHGLRHTWEGNGNTAQNDSQGNPEEDGNQVRLVEAPHGIAQHLLHRSNGLAAADHRHEIPVLETQAGCSPEVQTSPADAGNGSAEYLLELQILQRPSVQTAFADQYPPGNELGSSGFGMLADNCGLGLLLLPAAVVFRALLDRLQDGTVAVWKNTEIKQADS